MPRAKANEDRNQKIIAFVEAYDWSFQLVGNKFGLSRNAIAGIMFRHRHPMSERVKSPGGQSPNKVGTGYRHAGYYPSINALNSFVERGELA